MNFTRAELAGAFLIELERIEDDRGFFARTFCRQRVPEHGLAAEVAQANTAFNKRKGTLRGLHYQASPYEEAKLVRCTRGAVYDVIVDLRPGSRLVPRAGSRSSSRPTTTRRSTCRKASRTGTRRSRTTPRPRT